MFGYDIVSFLLFFPGLRIESSHKVVLLNDVEHQLSHHIVLSIQQAR